MYAARPASRLTCPTCGTLQESPGSTVCEQCGASLSRHEDLTSSSPLPASQRVGEAVAASLRAIVAGTRTRTLNPQPSRKQNTPPIPGGVRVPLISRNWSAGIGTSRAVAPVAGGHRARPSPTLDKERRMQLALYIAWGSPAVKGRLRRV